MMYKFAGAKKSFMSEVIWNGPFHFLNMIVKRYGGLHELPCLAARFLAARIRFLNRDGPVCLDLI